jgi:phosphatidylglycerol:prolipoprotein diacylglycerol transferase
MSYYIHNLDPIALDLGFFAIRWYSLAYMIGIFGGWWWVLRHLSFSPFGITKDHCDQYLYYLVFGVIIGGRLGHCLLYYPEYYLQNPLEILQIWQGGMAFHGGLIGVIVATYLFCRNNALPFHAMMDICALVAPIGLFFGRIANFINGELWGRTTDVAWAVIFPQIDDMPRHPSQLYEALGEGFILFIIMNILLYRMQALKRPLLLSGVFLIGYGMSRFLAEYVREMEILQDSLPLGLSYGQLLSLPMILLGIYLVVKAKPQSS